MKKTKEFPLSTEVDGKTIKGTRIVEGTRKLRQTIFFGLASRFDSKTYKPGEESQMQSKAKVFLAELIKETSRAAKVTGIRMKV